ncbi:MAG TPA: FAD-dependent monooxygenase [Xanthobacteraceae bacterium]|nr:FAD-dependent monooxygenase [Xanthobacteraceae bacterium]
MARSRSVVIVGAGIGGLTAALALAGRGFRVVVIDKAGRLEETGAGVQLSPNATRILIDLGLRDRLAPHIVAPEALRILRGRDGGEIVRVPLGAASELRHGAPHWVIHRGDLQAALLGALEATPDAELRLGTEVEDFAVHANGITVEGRCRRGSHDEHGIALIAADGLWSTMRQRLGSDRAPSFAHRTAWRAVVPADRVGERLREPSTHLWLGPDAHLVHYPVKAGRTINIVAIVDDDWQQAGWSAAGARDELLGKFSGWDGAARDLLAIPDRWLKWALYDRPAARRWGRGPVTLLGDAAHPMLPFIAQGAAMAIEDAIVLAGCLAATSGPLDAPLRQYEGLRCGRTARVQRHARRNGIVYHLDGPAAAVRNLALAAIGGDGLLRRYDWLYDWRAP